MKVSQRADSLLGGAASTLRLAWGSREGINRTSRVRVEVRYQKKDKLRQGEGVTMSWLTSRRCCMYSAASCCLPEENSSCPRPKSCLNILGATTTRSSQASSPPPSSSSPAAAAHGRDKQEGGKGRTQNNFTYISLRHYPEVQLSPSPSALKSAKMKYCCAGKAWRQRTHS